MEVQQTTRNSLIFIKSCKGHNENLSAAVRKVNELWPYEASSLSRICEPNSSWFADKQTLNLQFGER
jgi:hypothetical protein